MFEMNITEMYDKLKEHESTKVNADGEEYQQAPPNRLIKQPGNPDIIEIYYNNRWYRWVLVE